jgi:type IV pilus assembly protein PilC
MADFNYIAKDKTGNTVKGDVSAPDKLRALEILRGKSLLIIKLEEKKKMSLGFSLSIFKRKKKIPLDELVVFTRQMATLTGAGITIVNSLDTLAEQTQNQVFKACLQEVRDNVNTGSSLSEGMDKYRSLFSDFFINMVRAGESSGMLDEVLDRVATYLEKTNALQKKVKSALIYPTAVSCMAIGISLFMIIKVVPVFEEVFAGFGADLPGPTQFLINLSDGTRKHFGLILILLVGLVIGLKWYVSTEKGRFWLDGLKLRIPIFGPMLRKVAVSKFSRTLSTLVKSGVPILQSLEIVAKTSGNLIVQRTIDRVKDNVREGESIAGPMEKSGIFPPIVTRMISVGEKTGELEKMLTKIADFFDEQVDTMVDGLTSLIEPAIIAFLGIVIGGIVICMFLPIFQMSTIIGG